MAYLVLVVSKFEFINTSSEGAARYKNLCLGSNLDHPFLAYADSSILETMSRIGWLVVYHCSLAAFILLCCAAIWVNFILAFG